MTLPLPGDVGEGEWTARFVVSSGHFRISDKTVKSDAFIPYPYPDLSVTRHLRISEERLWQIGQSVAASRPATLYGRADLQAARFRMHGLTVTSDPIPGNPNHAIVAAWPLARSAQKSMAQLLAAEARFVETASPPASARPSS